MGQPLSGEKSQQDENALRQLHKIQNLTFLIRETRIRKFFKDNVSVTKFNYHQVFFIRNS